MRGELLAVRKRAAWRWWAFHKDKTGEEHRHKGKDSRPEWDWTIPDRHIFRSNCERLSLLDKDLVANVVDTYERIDDYTNALKFSYQGGPKTKWVKNILKLIFDQCTLSAKLLAEELGLPEEDPQRIEAMGEREHKELSVSVLEQREESK